MQQPLTSEQEEKIRAAVLAMPAMTDASITRVASIVREVGRRESGKVAA